MMRIPAGALLLFATANAFAAPQKPPTAKGKAPACVVRGSVAQLDVHCPSTTLAEFLLTVRNATGLRGEYPPEVASARLSLVVKRTTLAKALESALNGFNFAVWPDQQTRAGLYVSILGARQSADLPDAPSIGESPHALNPGTVSALPAPAADHQPARTSRRMEQDQAFGGQIGGQVSTSSVSGGGASTSRAELLPARSETVLAPPLANAPLLTPPTSGNTPILPQTVDGVILRPSP